MAIRKVLVIQEDEETLKKYVLRADKFWKERRARCILCLKQEKFKTLKELSGFLGLSSRQLYDWLEEYRTKGIDGFLSKQPRSGKGESSFITPEIHEGLAERIADKNDPFLGYWDAHKWVQSTYNKEIGYQVVRTYLRNQFNLRIKRPRKSHIRKDQQAEVAFLKTSREASRD